MLHVDGDTFFASCEVALDASLSGRPVWVGGGRNGNGIVIAANREAKRFGIATGMACFEAQRACPHGVLARPQYDEYRRLSQAMFRILEEYAPTMAPMSIDEGFLDLTTMDRHVWRHTSATEYVNGLRERIRREVGLPVSAGLGNSPWMAKLATSAAKPGFLEVPPEGEAEFLKDRPLSELCGVGKRRERALAALGARTFGDVARLPSAVLKRRFGIWGQQLWLFANGRWTEPVVLEVKARTTISSNTTLPHDEPDYGVALVFACSELARMVGQLRRERLQAREVGLGIRLRGGGKNATSCKSTIPATSPQYAYTHTPVRRRLPAARRFQILGPLLVLQLYYPVLQSINNRNSAVVRKFGVFEHPSQPPTHSMGASQALQITPQGAGLRGSEQKLDAHGGTGQQNRRGRCQQHRAVAGWAGRGQTGRGRKSRREAGGVR